MMKNKIIIVCGPTASGKSARALQIAQDQNGVIVNCDSLQIYEGMPILTAQPPPDDLAATPHSLYAHLHPNDVCSAGNWREMVEPVLHDIIGRGQTPVITGGTGLYIKALVDGLSPIPDIPDDVRAAVVERYEKIGAQEFYNALQARDPVMAARFHVNHKARIIRAMEVLEATGKSLSEWQKMDRIPPPENWEFEIIKVMPDRDTLYERCNTRFESMMENGAIEEVEKFQSRIDNGEISPGVPLEKALGFKQLRDYLHGEISKEDAITLAQGETRRYAKRQVTWFRNQM